MNEIKSKWRLFVLSHSTPHWYAIRVKSNRERVTADALRARDLEVLLPTQLDSRTRKPSLMTPLFPGYLFCRFDAHVRLPVLTVPGVVHIVGLGNVPLPIDPVEIAGVKAMIQSPLEVTPYPYPPLGRSVEIQAGPLRGVEGVVIAQKGEDKMVVSITLLQRSIAVALDREWVTLTPTDDQRQIEHVRVA
jgi:transcription antitermination factor NusG